MNDKKVLLIAREFIPYSISPGSIMRIVTLADFFYSNGYKIFVITSKSNCKHSFFGFKYILSKIHVEYIKDTYCYKFKRPYTLLSLSFKIRNKLLKYLNEFIIPDTGVFLTKKYKTKVDELINKHEIKIIYSTGPPFSIFKPLLAIKEDYGEHIKWICEYRDSWNTSIIHSKKSIFTKFFSEKLEKKILINIDYLIFVSPLIKTKIENKYNINLSKKSALVWNGFLKERTIDNTNHTIEYSKKINIAYFGIISNNKNSYYNISRLVKVIKENDFISRYFHFFFYGYNSIDEKLPNCIKIYNNIPHGIAIKKMQEMDYLLIIFADNRSSDEFVTGKLFDYISVKKPIICLTPKNMEAVRLITKYKIGIHIDIFDEKDIIKKFKEIINSKDKLDLYYKNIDVSIFNRKRQYNKLLKIITKLP